MAGAGQPGNTVTEAVQFQPRTAGAEMNNVLASGSSLCDVLGARDGQFINVRLVADTSAVDCEIINSG